MEVNKYQSSSLVLQILEFDAFPGSPPKQNAENHPILLIWESPMLGVCLRIGLDGCVALAYDWKMRITLLLNGLRSFSAYLAGFLKFYIYITKAQ